MKTPRPSLLAWLPSCAFVPLVFAAVTTSACGDDAAGAGGTGAGGDDVATSSAATPSSSSSNASSTGSTGGDGGASTADGVGGGPAGAGGAGGDTTGASSSGGGLGGDGAGGAGEGGEGGVGEGGDGSGGDGGSDGEGGSGGGTSRACLEITGSELALLTSGDGAFYYQGPSTVGFDGPDPDMIRLDLLSPDATGVIDLGFAAGQSAQTCEACVWVLADYVEQVVQKMFFVESGQLDLGASSPPDIQGSFLDVTLVEVEIDFDIVDFVPVEGGACLHIEEMAFDVET